MNRFLSRLALLAALALSTAACDGNGDESLPATTYTLRIDGGDTRTYSGSAFYGESNADGESLFGIFLGSEGESGEGISFIRLSAAPSAGRYNFVDPLGMSGMGLGSFVGVYLDPSQFGEGTSDKDLFAGIYYVRSGTLTLDQIDPEDSAEGSFRVTAQAVRLEGFDPDDPPSELSLEPTGEPISIEGEFNASFRSDLFEDVPTEGFPTARLLRR